MTDMHARLTAPKRRKIVLTKNWRGQYRWTLWTNSRITSASTQGYGSIEDRNYNLMDTLNGYILNRANGQVLKRYNPHTRKPEIIPMVVGTPDQR